MSSSYLYVSTFHLCFLKLVLLTGPFVFALVLRRERLTTVQRTVCRETLFLGVNSNSHLFCRPHTPTLALPRHTRCTHTAENLLLPAFGLNPLPPST
ncbi:hypothetical protein R3P38DRAFT_3009058 [Favolaschia claudopus]|uniref:Secreted protein n=1 Tax=Favolaschia claudopus TaxID=2862362 RepID=A0AAW0AK91_9AGAR